MLAAMHWPDVTAVHCAVWMPDEARKSLHEGVRCYIISSTARAVSQRRSILRDCTVGGGAGHARGCSTSRESVRRKPWYARLFGSASAYNTQVGTVISVQAYGAGTVLSGVVVCT